MAYFTSTNCTHQTWELRSSELVERAHVEGEAIKHEIERWYRCPYCYKWRKDNVHVPQNSASK
jgi:hypothetical protein